MKRGKPLERRTPMRRTRFEATGSRPAARRKAPRRSSRVRDPEYIHDGHRRACCARDIVGHRCQGAIEMDHVGARGYGQKSHDSEAIPLCQLGHRERTDHSGAFRDMPRADERAWKLRHVALEQEAYYGRALSVEDLQHVAEAVATGRPTRGLFATSVGDGAAS